MTLLLKERDPRERMSTKAMLAKVTGILFIVLGGAKLMGLSMVEQQFVGWGYSHWFMIIIGGIEATSGLLLLSGTMNWLGAFGIGIVMLGAIFTHVRAAEWVMLPLPMLVLGIAIVLLKDESQVAVGRKVSPEESSSREPEPERRFTGTTGRMR